MRTLLIAIIIVLGLSTGFYRDKASYYKKHMNGYADLLGEYKKYFTQPTITIMKDTTNESYSAFLGYYKRDERLTAVRTAMKKHPYIRIGEHPTEKEYFAIYTTMHGSHKQFWEAVESN